MKSTGANRKGLWAGVTLIGACAACCAVPLLGMLGLGSFSAAAFSLVSSGALEVVFCTAALLGGAAFVYFALRKLKKKNAAQACVTSCAVDQSCCDLEAAKREPSCALLPTELTQRAAEFRRLFSQHLVDRSRDGSTVIWRFRAAPGVEEGSRRLASLERACCDGLTFEITRTQDFVTWSISGPTRAKTLLDEFASMPSTVQGSEAPARALSIIAG
jgi:hypothetical protein